VAKLNLRGQVSLGLASYVLQIAADSSAGNTFARFAGQSPFDKYLKSSPTAKGGLRQQFFDAASSLFDGLLLSNIFGVALLC